MICKERKGVSFSSCVKGKDSCTFVFINNVDTAICGKDNTINYCLQYDEIAVGKYSAKGAKNFVISDGQFIPVVANDPKMFPGALRRSGSCDSSVYERITNLMKKYQDCGECKRLEVVSEKLIATFRAKGDIDLEVVVRIHRGVMYIYQNNLILAEREINEAMVLAERAENRQFLIARCELYLAHIALYRKEHDTVMELLERAKSNLFLYVSCEDSALLLYLLGYLNMNKAAESIEHFETLESSAIACFDDEIRHAMEDPSESAVKKKQIFATLKKVSILLRTYSPPMFEHEASEDNVNKAKQLLDEFELRLWTDASPAGKLHFAVLQADYFFRKGQPVRALDIIQAEGQQKAQSIGHKPLLQMVKSRIEIYEKIVPPADDEIERLDEEIDDFIEELLRTDDRKR